LQRVGQLGPDLVLLVGREDVDDPVHRLRRVLGVEGAEHEVSRRPNSPSPPSRSESTLPNLLESRF
jgi:hypothetical protein